MNEESINKTVEEKIRPMLQSHGGDMEVVSIEENVVKIKYQGACGGCPHAAQATLQMIQQIMQQECSPEISVQLA